MKPWLLSFCSSNLDGWIRSPLKRIRRQAEAMGVFDDRLRVWTERDLDAGFRERMGARLDGNPRGYGYWSWKPQIVLQALREMPEGDVLLYVDAGCHLNPRGRKRLLEYFRLAQEHGIVVFQSRSRDEARKGDASQHFLTDGAWCKGDLLDFFGVRGDASVTATGQLGGTAFLVCKTAETLAFFTRFLSVFEGHFELCDDSPSRLPNLPGFVENRHDQSVFSLLGKEKGVFSLSCGEYARINGFAPRAERRDVRHWPRRWSDLADCPIWARHDKGGIRSLVPEWAKNAAHRMTGGRI